MNPESVIEKAMKVLEENWLDLGNGLGFTMPSDCLYPFQWNWDSGFIAYAYAHIAPSKALSEMRALFSGQWDNGFLPHMVFHKKHANYFPGPDVWNCKSGSNVPRGLHTSGITQPPVVALTIWHLYEIVKETDEEHALEILREFYPKILHCHRHLKATRDPENSGLITIMHPWESGLDNSPRWDEALEQVESMDMSQFDRHDTACVSADTRPSDEEYGKYLYLVTLMRNECYDHAAMYDDFPFKIKDIIFSSIFQIANSKLLKMATELGEQLPEAEEWMQQFGTSISSRCWHKDDQFFYDIDLTTNTLITKKSVAGLSPLMTDAITADQRTAVMKHLFGGEFCGDGACPFNLAPSTPLKEAFFNPNLYWRGPIWINMNWLLWHALRDHGETEKAQAMKQAMLQLVTENGFWEYYNPETGKGLGATNFSWTAALVIDLLHEKTDTLC